MCGCVWACGCVHTYIVWFQESIDNFMRVSSKRSPPEREGLEFLFNAAHAGAAGFVNTPGFKNRPPVSRRGDTFEKAAAPGAAGENELRMLTLLRYKQTHF